MGRLIDADRLKDERRTLPMMSNWGEMLISLLIDEQPTAYDIDRVIEQLEALKETIYKSYGLGSGAYVAVCNAIEIVKEGGAENDS